MMNGKGYMDNILLVEDDVILSHLITKKFAEKNIIVHQVYNGEGVKKAFFRHAPNCIILDIGLPGMSGYKVYSELKHYYNGPIIFLTSHDTDLVESASLKLGVDDFVSKEKGFDVLYQRVVRLLPVDSGGSNKKIIDKKIFDIKIGNFYFNKRKFRCEISDKKIELTNDETEMLFYLLVNKNRLITRDELYLALKGVSFDGVSRSIDIAISRLKDKLVQNGVDRFIITTIRGKGYSFNSHILSDDMKEEIQT